ncbi:MAG TPA: hypothetical protein DGB72_04385, partial [Gemmatimonadetes bacterium]|nr:hypothetical protein [Gemmatimonadota bacterium]
ASTSSGFAAASIARRCEGEGSRGTETASVPTDAASEMDAVSVRADPPARVVVTVRCSTSYDVL